MSQFSRSGEMKNDSDSVLKLVMAPGHIRILLPTGGSCKLALEVAAVCLNATQHWCLLNLWPLWMFLGIN